MNFSAIPPLTNETIVMSKAEFEECVKYWTQKITEYVECEFKQTIDEFKQAISSQSTHDAMLGVMLGLIIVVCFFLGTLFGHKCIPKMIKLDEKNEPEENEAISEHPKTE